MYFPSQNCLTPGYFVEMDGGEDEGGGRDREVEKRAADQGGQPRQSGKVNNAEMKKVVFMIRSVYFN